MSLEERMALRREMAFQVVRDVLGEWGLPETSYRFKVVPMDPRGHTYAAMIDLPIQFTSEINVGHKELKRLGVVIDGAARTRFKVRVLGVYWRISDSLTVDLSDQVMSIWRPTNSCHSCGATAYRPVLARNERGVMQPTGQYQCVQCKLQFTDIREWREGSGTGPTLLQPVNHSG